MVFSTALKMYDEYVAAHVNRMEDETLKQKVGTASSELYGNSFGYRLIYSMRNAIQPGVGNLIRLEGAARLVRGSDTEVESELHIYLQREAFDASKANAAVRKQVRELNDDLDLLPICQEAYAGVRALHARLTTLIHPGAPATVHLLRQYIEEVGRERVHFHEYIRGLAAKGTLETMTLDREGFTYVIAETGGQVVYDADAV